MRDAVSGVGLVGCLLLLVPLLAGCQTNLPPTPNLYADAAANPYAETPAAFRSTLAPMVYFTDRARVDDPDEPIPYTHERSRSLAWGVADCQIGAGLTWDQLVAASRTSDRARKVPMQVDAVTELGRYPDAPLPLERHGKLVRLVPQAQAELDEADEAVKALVREQLKAFDTDTVILSVHGVQISFETAITRGAEWWHLSGRRAAMFVYTWPAGHPDLLASYHYDYATSLYTVHHFKYLLRLLGEMDEVRRVHIVAHSRGCDVVNLAMRELMLAAQTDVAPGSALKIGQLVLIAPDIDWETVLVRDVARLNHAAADRVTVYVSPSDRALTASRLLWRSGRRMGRLTSDDLSPRERELLRLTGRIDFVQVDAPSDILRHNYFSSPEVLSDLILLLQDERRPGAQFGRPLKPTSPGFWLLPKDYPNQTEKKQ